MRSSLAATVAAFIAVLSAGAVLIARGQPVQPPFPPSTNYVYAKQVILGVQVPLTLTQASYTQYACVGTVQTVNFLVQQSGDGGTMLLGITLVDTAGGTSASAIDFIVFRAAPTGTYTDASSCAIASQDQSKIAAYVPGARATCGQDSGAATVFCAYQPAQAMNVINTTTSNQGSQATTTQLYFLGINPNAGSGGGSAKTVYLNITASPD